jgi:hypothetical protein
LVLIVSGLAEELKTTFVPTSMFFEGFRNILGTWGRKDLRVEESLLWLGFPTFTIATAWLGGYKLQQPTCPLVNSP